MNQYSQSYRSNMNIPCRLTEAEMMMMFVRLRSTYPIKLIPSCLPNPM